MAPSPAERQRELVAFYDRYEELVEVLCDAAQLGPAPRLEARYQDARRRVASAYPSLQPFMAAYLRYNTEEAEEQAADPFNELISSETLDDFLASDDGEMISRITRTREAANLYAEHLRQLLARSA